MTGHNVEEVFSIAAKDLYVKARMKEDEEAQNDQNTVGGGEESTDKSKKSKSKTTAGIELKADKKKTLDQKKKDKGCC